MTERFGIYFAPAIDDELWKLGCQWLGRDCARGTNPTPPHFAQISAEELHKATTSPRRYGMHATIKAPMALKMGTSQAELEAALGHFAQTNVPVKIGRLKLKSIGRFLALVPENQTIELENIAAKTVRDFDDFRAPLSSEKRAERMAAGLTKKQINLLDKWGYPYVMDQFRMHITLSNSLDKIEGPKMLSAAERWFAPILEKEHYLDRLCLFKEPAPDHPFDRIADFEFSASTDETRP